MSFRKPRTQTVFLSVSLAAALSGAMSLLAGCSSNATSANGASNAVTTSAKTSVPVLITDAPSDGLVTFSLTLNSITLTDSVGKTASVLSTPTTVEACHLNGIEEALLTANIPQDTYVSATFTFSNPQVTYVNASGATVVATPVLATSTYTATFASPITISATSGGLLVDLLASQSVVISGTTVTVSPVFKVTSLSASGDGHRHNGGNTHQFGTVTSVSSTSVVIQSTSGTTQTFTVDSSTLYQGVTASTLAAGALVEVDFSVQTDGSLLATRISVETRSEGGGRENLLTGVVAKGVTASGFQITLGECLGAARSTSTTGTLYTITTTSGTTYATTPQFTNLTGLPFTPVFSAATLVPGQNVGVVAASVSGTTATATTVYLLPQTLSGTVASVTTSGAYTVYTLTLTSGSTFNALTGATTAVVYTSSDTVMSSSAAIAVGSTVRFNGLVFNDGGTFRMVSGAEADGR